MDDMQGEAREVMRMDDTRFTLVNSVCMSVATYVYYVCMQRQVMSKTGGIFIPPVIVGSSRYCTMCFVLFSSQLCVNKKIL